LNLVFFATLAIVAPPPAANDRGGSIAQLTAAGADDRQRRSSPCRWRPICASEDLGEALSRASRDRQRAEGPMRESGYALRAIVDQTRGHFDRRSRRPRPAGQPRPRRDHRYSVAELRTKTLFDITHPDDRPKNLALLAAMMSSGTSYTIEKRFIRRDGRVVWVQVSSVAVRNSPACRNTHRPRPSISTNASRLRWRTPTWPRWFASSADAIESCPRRYRLSETRRREALWLRRRKRRSASRST